MVYVHSDELELRGIANKNKKDGGVYYLVNVEESDGTAHSFYCPNASSFPSGLKKGDKISLTFEIRTFGNSKELVVTNVVRINEEK